ncbi:MAG: hypothetical protein V1834_01230 [Candidatus Micrarchaeota archaeon]
MDEQIIEETIVWTLYRAGCWGKGHLSETKLFKSGFPPHLGIKNVKKIGEKLRKRGLLVCAPTGREVKWWLNSNKQKEIEEVIERRKKRLLKAL